MNSMGQGTVPKIRGTGATLALTRKLLEGLGIEGKHIETIIEAHSETVNALKSERDRYKEDAEKTQDLQKKLEEAESNTDLRDLQAKYDKLKKSSDAQAESLKKSDDALAKLEEERDQLQKSLDEATERGVATASERDELNDKLNALTEERDALRNEYDEYKAGIDAQETMRTKAAAYRKQVLEAAGVGSPYLDDVMGVTKLDGVELDEDGNLANAEDLINAAREKWGSFIVKTKTEPADVETPPVTKGTSKFEGAHERAIQIARERHERLYGKSEE